MMRHYLFFFVLLFVLPLSASTICLEEASIELGGGYRQDDFKWSIQGPAGIPKVAAKVMWKDLGIWQIEGQAKVRTKFEVYSRLRWDYGWIKDGYVEESDFFGTKTTPPELIFHSTDTLNRGKVYDWNWGIGYVFTWCERELSIIPLLGYATQVQHLQMPRGRIVTFAENNLTSSDSSSKSKKDYRARWYGPWLGFDILYHLYDWMEIFITYEFHWIDYRGKGLWERREDIPDGFKHKARGFGNVFRIGTQYDFKNGNYLSAFIHYQIWRTRLGNDVNPLFITVDEGTINDFSEPLNQVHWRSLAFAINWGYLF